MCTALSCRDSGLEDKPEPPGDPTADGVREDSESAASMGEGPQRPRAPSHESGLSSPRTLHGFAKCSPVQGGGRGNVTQKGYLSFVSPTATQEPPFTSLPHESPKNGRCAPQASTSDPSSPLTLQRLWEELREPAACPTLWEGNPASRSPAQPRPHHTPPLLPPFLGRTPVSSKNRREETPGGRPSRPTSSPGSPDLAWASRRRGPWGPGLRPEPDSPFDADGRTTSLRPGPAPKN